MNKLILEQKYWILGFFLVYLSNILFMIFILNVTINIGFFFSILISFNFVLSLTIFMIILNNKKIKDKKIFLIGLILVSIISIYLSYGMIDFEFRDKVSEKFRVVSLTTSPIAVLIVLIGVRRILK
jgi:hypothetical protein